MKLLARLCIRFNHFPRRRWFYRAVMETMFTPFEDPRNPEAESGVIQFGANATPRQVANFQRWWKDTH